MRPGVHETPGASAVARAMVVRAGITGTVALGDLVRSGAHADLAAVKSALQHLLGDVVEVGVIQEPPQRLKLRHGLHGLVLVGVHLGPEDLTG